MQFQFRKWFEVNAPKKLQFQDTFTQSSRRFPSRSADLIVLTNLFTQSMSGRLRGIWDQDEINQSMSCKPWGKLDLWEGKKLALESLLI